MIRRLLPDTNPSRWAIIDQIDHATLAAQVAEVWGARPFAPLEPRAALLWAVAHHDDGWRAWDRAPKVDPATGTPRQFTEMLPADSLAIWSASIDLAAAQGPLEGYVVAGHFATLAERAALHMPELAQELAQELAEFCAHYRRGQADWLARWQRLDPREFTPELAERCLRQLQFFDALSLWFCCEQVTEPETAEPPASPAVLLTPSGKSEGVLAVRLDPWPLVVSQLDLQVPARIVPARRYALAAELANEPSQSEFLRWQVSPGRGEKV